MDSSEESTGPSQLVVTVAALAAGLVAQQVVSAGWRIVRGTDPNGDDDSPLPEVLIFAAVSAATVAVARKWAARRMRHQRA